MYVKRRHQIWVEPAITGHGYKASFQKDFYNQATRDETPFCVVPEAVKFYKELGGYVRIFVKYLSGLGLDNCDIAVR